MENTTIEFNEVDYIVPTETFKIEFSYLSKQGFPFIKEFLLKALYISPLSKFELSSFFGFNQRELAAAIEEPISKGEIAYSDDGKLFLTPLAKGYFSSLDDKPMVEKPQTRTASLSFELAGFNKVKNQHDNWHSGLRLKANHEIQSLSEQHARAMFTKHFQQLVQNDELGGFKIHENSLPSLYSVDKVTRKKTIAHRIRRRFEIDLNNQLKPLDLRQEYVNDEAVAQEILNETDNFRLSNNLNSIISAWDTFEDMSISRFINDASIDLRSLLAEMVAGSYDKPYYLILGPLYGKQPFSVIENHLKQLKPFKKAQKAKVLSWYGANTRYWGMSEGFNNAKATLINYSNKGKSRNYELKLYLPCDNHPNVESQAGKLWKHKLGNLEFCEGIRNGLFDGSVEVLVLEGEFAAVSYHLALPDISPVHIPLGFFTTDQKLIANIVRIANEFLKSSASNCQPNLIGKL
ncbi:TPA: hypothetical protein RQJ47_002758 [Vibrio vulnificus]|uniref:hypothetical protein n=1 Tax=Vibrio harveyi group TaxID=717610 RepID=UPI000413AA4F|nr:MULTISPECIES: hypothetical protein [Vibrio harveyi group]HDY7459785.1 hypothetical protein [Vibrio vulnificus]EGU9030726.1 hypothetical protein [Vibrio parahaemolyticus]EJE4173309.1 hypothetical protein [Vibrio parahaemolyticus]MBS9933189.1 hypothetical protein [Vibrio alginolyticus]TPA17279.1 hypothetical protein DXE05_02515 [Vibrio parahaemolyticus]